MKYCFKIVREWDGCLAYCDELDNCSVVSSEEILEEKIKEFFCFYLRELNMYSNFSFPKETNLDDLDEAIKVIWVKVPLLYVLKLYIINTVQKIRNKIHEKREKKNISHR